MGRILITDDSEPMRKLVQIVLSSAGHEVVTASDGEEGKRLFSPGKFDMVITDINMPRLNGYDFISEIRRVDGQIAILALTTEMETLKKERGIAAGADGWMVKPFKPAEFLGMVKRMLDAGAGRNT